MGRFITVTTRQYERAKLDIEKCTSWVERHPLKSKTVYLHRNRKGKWFIQNDCRRAKHLSYNYEIGDKEAVQWLMDEEYDIPQDCLRLDDRIDVTDDAPEDKTIVGFICIKCNKMEGFKQYQCPTEAKIMDAVGEVPLIGREIARRAGLVCNSHFRSCLARLSTRLMLEYVRGQGKASPKGYRLPK